MSVMSVVSIFPKLWHEFHVNVVQLALRHQRCSEYENESEYIVKFQYC